jgi:outer membrane immunogenic protein
LAADLGRPVLKAPPPLPPPVQDWSGVYVGVEGGYGWGHQSASGTVPFTLNGLRSHCTGTECNNSEEFAEFLRRNDAVSDPSIPFSGRNSSGGVVGGFFGVQKQWGSWVLGLEGSIDYANITSSSGSNISATSGGFLPETDEFVTKTISGGNFSTRIDTIGAVNAKIGYAWSPNWMIYGTGGLAFAHQKNNLSFNEHLFHLDCDSGSCDSTTGDFVPGSFAGFVRTANSSFNGTSGTSMFGWEAGGGIDYKWQLDPGSAVIFGIDYKHYGFGQHTVTFAAPDGASFSVIGSQDVDVIKGRISYLFSIH